MKDDSIFEGDCSNASIIFALYGNTLLSFFSKYSPALSNNHTLKMCSELWQGGYALYFVFSSYAIAGIFGLFWGLLIFNLDRFIVNTMYSDGKHTISWAEIRSGLPRIIMAIFLGLVIPTQKYISVITPTPETQQPDL